MCPMHGVDVGHSAPDYKPFSPVYGAVEKTRRNAGKPTFKGLWCPTIKLLVALGNSNLAVRCPTAVHKLFHSFRRLWTTSKGGDANDPEYNRPYAMRPSLMGRPSLW